MSARKTLPGFCNGAERSSSDCYIGTSRATPHKSIGDYNGKVAALTFDEIDLTKAEDGIYEGPCDTGVVRARVQVTVQNHQLESIELLEHENGRGTPAEAILDQMVQNQTTAVDAVSGATCSSKVIRKAVENALAAGLSDRVRQIHCHGKERYT